MQQSLCLKGQFLISMPNMADPRFSQSIIYLIMHNNDGAMGIVINKIFPDINFEKILAELNINSSHTDANINVHYGGPVEIERGFVLHTKNCKSISTLNRDNIEISSSIEFITDLAQGRGPKNNIFVLGHAGWGPGQLEDELSKNVWINAPYNKDIMFDEDINTKWERSLENIGVTLSKLSSIAGNA
tara:strand:- start:11169 stop:11729 length:561 start_codon:yes stop_codon:yes gene_type:complete